MAGIWRADGSYFAIAQAGHGVNAIPSLAPQLTAIGSGGSQAVGPLGIRQGYRRLLHGDTTIGPFGTSGGAQRISLAIYRYLDPAKPVGTGAGGLTGGGGSGTTVAWGDLTEPLDGDNVAPLLDPWVLAWAQGTGTNGNLTANPPAGATAVLDTLSGAATVRGVFYDSGGPLSAWSPSSRAIGSGGAHQWGVATLRADPAGPGIEFVYADGGAGGTIALPEEIVEVPGGDRHVHRFPLTGRRVALPHVRRG